MGVAIDKSRGNTVVEGVSVKSVTEGGSAALAKSSRGVGLKIGMYNAVDVILRCSFWQTCNLFHGCVLKLLQRDA